MYECLLVVLACESLHECTVCMNTQGFVWIFLCAMHNFFIHSYVRWSWNPDWRCSVVSRLNGMEIATFQARYCDISARKYTAYLRSPENAHWLMLTWILVQKQVYHHQAQFSPKGYKDTKQHELHRGEEISSHHCQSSGAVWKSRWPSWAPVPNKPTVSVDVKQDSTSELDTKPKKQLRELALGLQLLTASSLECKVGESR